MPADLMPVRTFCPVVWTTPLVVPVCLGSRLGPMRQQEAPSSTELAVSAAIEEARRARRLRPEAVCVAAGMSRASYYNRLTTGGWRLVELERVAGLLELPLAELLGFGSIEPPLMSSLQSPSAEFGSYPHKSGCYYERAGQTVFSRGVTKRSFPICSHGMSAKLPLETPGRNSKNYLRRSRAWSRHFPS